MFKKHTQVDDIIETMQKNGGYATLAYLNQNVDTSTWKTKLPLKVSVVFCKGVMNFLKYNQVFGL